MTDLSEFFQLSVDVFISLGGGGHVVAVRLVFKYLMECRALDGSGRSGMSIVVVWYWPWRGVRLVKIVIGPHNQ
eukprot:13683562-Ditylum_brightwellii.AAC.1